MIAKTRRVLRGQRGDGKIGAVIAILVVALVIHVGVKFIPFRVQAAEFEKAVERRLERLAGNLTSEEEFLEGVRTDAEQMEIPLKEENLTIELVGATYKVKASYEVVLGMIWGDWVQSVDVERERPKF